MQNTTLQNCPVCDTPAELYDVVDFNKSCTEAQGVHLPLCGVPIYYRRCGACEYTWAPEFREWPDQDFLNYIYNEDYIHVDPDYLTVRPEGNAASVAKLFGHERARIRHLDYGGGNGSLSSLLAQQGWDTTSYDPFPGDGTSAESLGKFNLITSFEVFEHVPDPNILMASLRMLMDDSECLVLFSTLASEGNIVPRGRLNWWYASPRNGHISLFSIRSLAVLAEKYGLGFRSFNATTHCFYTTLPTWSGISAS